MISSRPVGPVLREGDEVVPAESSLPGHFLHIPADHSLGREKRLPLRRSEWTGKRLRKDRSNVR